MASSPDKSPSSSNSPKIQDLNNPTVDSPPQPSSAISQGYRAVPSSMEEPNSPVFTMGESSYSTAMVLYEPNPTPLSFEMPEIGIIPQEMGTQNPSVSENLSHENKSENVETDLGTGDSEKRDEGVNVEPRAETEEEDDEDNMPLAFRWGERRRMVTPSIEQKLKGKASSSEQIRTIPTRSSSRKILSDAMEANKAQTTQNRRKRKNVVLEEEDIVDISLGEKDTDEDIVRAVEKRRRKVQSEKSSPQTRSQKKRIATKGRKTRSSKRSAEKGKEVEKEDDHTGKETEEVASEKDMEFDEGPGPTSELTKKQRSDILRTQKVLSGRMIDPEYASRPGMCDLVDAIEMQGWSHLFLEWPVPTLHGKEVKDFYCNMTLNDDDTLDTVVNDHHIHLSEFILGAILRAERAGVKTVVKASPSSDFLSEIVKSNNRKRTTVPKKFMKGTFQMFFEFVNKNLLPRSEKRTVATASDLFLMECLSKMDDINLPSIMMEHFKKILTKRDGKHGLAYGYLLGRVFEHLKVPLSIGTKGTLKQAFSLHTLVECECVEDREGKSRKSQTSELLEMQEQLRHEVLSLTEIIKKKDVEIAKLKAGVGESSGTGPGTSAELNDLQAENAHLKEENAQLTGQVNELKDRLIKSHEDSAARMTMLLQNLTPKP